MEQDGTREALPTRAKKQKPVDVDYRAGVPGWIQEVIEAHLAIEEEDAKQSGNLGFMARAMVQATMPYKDPKTHLFIRRNGNFELSILSRYGVPFGIYPRLLLSWVTTEAVKRQSPTVQLGETLREFMADVMGVRSLGGGPRGTATRVTEQMKRLFGSLITGDYKGTGSKRDFHLKNVLIADDLRLDDENRLWTPQSEDEAGKWKSYVTLSKNFFEECTNNPVPIDLRAYRALRASPLAMDLYTWLTYRMSRKPSNKPIPWESLMMQFGSAYTTNQAHRDFKKAFIPALKKVLFIYHSAKVDVTEAGLMLLPSPTHVARTPALPVQTSLFAE